jgi:Na+/H+ antiporter NhaD/arsenite permease-like protein
LSGARVVLTLFPLLTLLAPDAAHAAAALHGASLQWPWALPFLGILLTIATGPLLFQRIWHRHYGKLALAWSIATLAPLAIVHGTATALAAFVHVMLAEYLSFIILLFALYVVAGGILVRGILRGTPLVNTAILAFGTAIASVVGTTGAAMILIRPLLAANSARLDNAQVVIFFIFLVANIGGALSPLGDPPLFLGFLHGIDFFWPARNLWLQTSVVAGVVLAIFVAVDIWYYRTDRLVTTVGEGRPSTRLAVSGGINLLLIAGIIAIILGAATWKPDITFVVYGTELTVQNLVRDVVLLLIALLSLILTPSEHREANGFTWEPIAEVAILFAGIFTCIIPVLAVLEAGKEGAFSWLLAALTTDQGQPREIAYFWVTGALSAFLDNAPTYLVLFELTGGDARELMGPLAGTLAAISMGAVYMGAMTYIGNAPNFMVYAIATERGVKMPSFFGYMLWSAVVLLPVWLLLTVLIAMRI